MNPFKLLIALGSEQLIQVIVVIFALISESFLRHASCPNRFGVPLTGQTLQLD